MKGSLLQYWHHVLFQHERLSDSFYDLPDPLEGKPGPVYVLPFRSADCIPLWIPAVLTPEGTLQVPEGPCFPWIPLATLNSTALYERCLLEFEPSKNWSTFYQNCLDLFETVIQGAWVLDQNKVQIIPQSAVPHVITAQADLWDSLFKMQALPSLVSTVLASAGARDEETSESFQTFLKSEDLQALEKQHAGHMGSQLLDQNKRIALLHLLDLPVGGIQATHTPPHTGKETLIADYAASHWVLAALKKEKPPIIVLTSATLAPSAPPSLLNEVDFLERCSVALGETMIEVEAAKQAIHQKLSQTYQALCEGLSKIQQETQQEDLDAKLLQLQNQDQELEAQFEMLNEGLRLWQAELPTVRGWRQAIEWATQSKKSMRDALTACFVNKGLVGVACLDWLEIPFGNIEAMLQNKISDIRVRRTQLHNQLIPLCEKMAKRSHSDIAWLQWQQQYAIKGDSHLLSIDPQAFLDETVRRQALIWARYYWEAYSLLAEAKTGRMYHPLERQAMRSPYIILPIDAMDGSKWPILHTWIAEDASNLSPMRAVTWLMHAERAIALGDSLLSNLASPLISSMDAAYCRHFGLANDEDELEDFSFSGQLASTANWWQLAAVASTFQSDDFSVAPGSISLSLNQNTMTHPALVACIQSNGYTGVIEASKSTTARSPFGYLHIKGRVEGAEGNFTNPLEARQLVVWLQANRSTLKLDPDYPNKLAIVTPFVAQKALLTQWCLGADLSFIPIWTIAELSADHHYGVVLFSPTYTASSQRPFSFDRGSSFLNKMLFAAEEALFVIGDMEAFDPAMHSPSGKLAKCLFSKSEYALPHHHILARPGVSYMPQPIDLDALYNQLQDTLVAANDCFVLVTSRVSPGVMVALDWVTQIRTAVARGVEVIIYIGDSPEQGWQDSAVQAIVQDCIDAGAFVRVVHHLQGSACWADNLLFLESLQSWLAVTSASHFSVQAYRGEVASVLIGERQAELGLRTIRRFKPKVSVGA